MGLLLASCCSTLACYFFCMNVKFSISAGLLTPCFTCLVHGLLYWMLLRRCNSEFDGAMFSEESCYSSDIRAVAGELSPNTGDPSGRFNTLPDSEGRTRPIVLRESLGTMCSFIFDCSSVTRFGDLGGNAILLLVAMTSLLRLRLELRAAEQLDTYLCSMSFWYRVF